MTVTVAIDLGHEFSVKAPFGPVFDLLSDVPASGGHFPKVQGLSDEGGGVYRWALEKVGPAQLKLQIVYASRYASQRAQGSVVWTPVAGVGNAQVGGSWKITDRQGSTGLEFKVRVTVDVPVPGMLRAVVAPIVKAEFEGLVQQYIDSLVRHFGGPAA